MAVAKNVEFEDWTAKYEDEDGDERSTTERVHVATKDTADSLGSVLTRTGTHSVREGDALVETGRPGVYDVHDKKTWGDLGYSKGSEAPSQTSDASAPAPEDKSGTAEGESGTDEDTPGRSKGVKATAPTSARK